MTNFQENKFALARNINIKHIPITRNIKLCFKVWRV